MTNFTQNGILPIHTKNIFSGCVKSRPSTLVIIFHWARDRVYCENGDKIASSATSLSQSQWRCVFRVVCSPKLAPVLLAPGGCLLPLNGGGGWCRHTVKAMEIVGPVVSPFPQCLFTTSFIHLQNDHSTVATWWRPTETGCWTSKSAHKLPISDACKFVTFIVTGVVDPVPHVPRLWLSNLVVVVLVRDIIYTQLPMELPTWQRFSGFIFQFSSPIRRRFHFD